MKIFIGCWQPYMPHRVIIILHHHVLVHYVQALPENSVNIA